VSTSSDPKRPLTPEPKTKESKSFMLNPSGDNVWVEVREHPTWSHHDCFTLQPIMLFMKGNSDALRCGFSQGVCVCVCVCKGVGSVAG
jgi:hypothetical protein